MNFFNFVEVSHFLIDNYVNSKDVVVDCTCGNGFDSLYLCDKLQGEGFLYSFDIQREAIERTEKLLKEKCNYNNYSLIKDSHENIKEYIEDRVNFAIYNLGYLPNSDSEIKTHSKSTISSIKSLLEILEYRGVIVITAYTGHDKFEERNAIFNFLENLKGKEFSVMNMRLINLNKYPPEIFIIQKDA